MVTEQISLVTSNEQSPKCGVLILNRSRRLFPFPSLSSLELLTKNSVYGREQEGGWGHRRALASVPVNEPSAGCCPRAPGGRAHRDVLSVITGHLWTQVLATSKSFIQSHRSVLGRGCCFSVRRKRVFASMLSSVAC